MLRVAVFSRFSSARRLTGCGRVPSLQDNFGDIDDMADMGVIEMPYQVYKIRLSEDTLCSLARGHTEGVIRWMTLSRCYPLDNTVG